MVAEEKTSAADVADEHNGEAEVIIVDWNDVVKDNSNEIGVSKGILAETLERALGPSGIGILAIRNVPGFVEAKMALLPLAHLLQALPSDYLENQLSDKESLYNTGWSHGKEKLGNDKKADFSKASFYYNPLTDHPGTLQDRADYPLSYPANKWPEDDMMEGGFKDAATTLGKILTETVIALTRHIDILAQSKVKGYAPSFLYNAMKDTDKVKARLLYYYPLKDDDDDDTGTAEDSWIGWHNDSGFLTALAGDLYVDHATGRVVPCPDPAAGLYVADRRRNNKGSISSNNNNNNDNILHVTIPPDCMAVQMGECAQIVTGGVLSATPHCVRGIQTKKRCHEDNNTEPAVPVARISLACFIDTPPTFGLTMPTDCTRQQVLATTNPRVPPLDQRWTRDGMMFGDFLQQTFAMYYNWTTTTIKTTSNKEDDTAAVETKA